MKKPYAEVNIYFPDRTLGYLVDDAGKVSLTGGGHVVPADVQQVRSLLYGLINMQRSIVRTYKYRRPDGPVGPNMNGRIRR